MKTYRDFSEIKGAYPLGTVVKVLLPKEQEYVLYADGWHKRTFEQEQTTGGGSDRQFAYFEFNGDIAGRTVVDVPVNDKTIRYVKMAEYPISFPDYVGVTFYGGKESEPMKYGKGEQGDVVYYGGGSFPDIVCIKKGTFANAVIPEDGVYTRYAPDWYISKCEFYEIDTPKCWQVDHREEDMLPEGEYPIKWESGKVFELPMKDLDTEAVYQMSLVLKVDGYKSRTMLEQLSVFFNGSTWFGYGKNINVELFYSPRGANIYCRVTEVNPAITILYEGQSGVPELTKCTNHRTEVPIKKLDFYEQGRIYDDVVRFRLGNNVDSGQVSIDVGEIIFVGDEVFVNCSQEADSSEAISTMRVPTYLLPIIVQKKLDIDVYRHHTGYKWRDSEQTVPDNYCAVWSNGDGTVDIETKIQAGTEFRERLEFYLRMDN